MATRKITKKTGIADSYFVKKTRKKLAKGIEAKCAQFNDYCASKAPRARHFDELSEDEQQQAIAIWCAERGYDDAVSQLKDELRSFFKQIGGEVTHIDLSAERCTAQVSLNRRFRLISDVCQPGTRRNCSAEFDDMPFPSEETCFTKASALWADRYVDGIDDYICVIDDLCIDAVERYGKNSYRTSVTISQTTKQASYSALRLWKTGLSDVLNQCLDECVEILSVIDDEDFYFYLDSNDEVFFDESCRML